MPRIRSVHPSLWTDEAFVSCSMAARLLVIGVWTEADDQGVFAWKPTVLKMRLFPADTVDMPSLLGELEANKLITRFVHKEEPFGAIRDFRKFQRPKKPNKVHPLPKDLEAYVFIPKPGSDADTDEHEQIAPPFPPGGEPVPNPTPADAAKVPNRPPVQAASIPPPAEPVPHSTASNAAPVTRVSEPVPKPTPSNAAPVPKMAEPVPPKGEKSPQREEGGEKGRREEGGGGEKKIRESSSSIRREPARDDDDLRRKLREAAKGRVERGCANVAPIQRLIDEGYSLERDILPYLSATIPKLKAPLRTWGAPWIAFEIQAWAEQRRADEASAATHPKVAPRPENVFVAKDSAAWPACAERYRRDHSTKIGPPAYAKNPDGKGREGWYFPPEFLDAAAVSAEQPRAAE